MFIRAVWHVTGLGTTLASGQERHGGSCSIELCVWPIAQPRSTGVFFVPAWPEKPPRSIGQASPRPTKCQQINRDRVEAPRPGGQEIGVGAPTPAAGGGGADKMSMRCPQIWPQAVGQSVEEVENHALDAAALEADMLEDVTLAPLDPATSGGMECGGG